ncbi:IPTL-CTERM sorting domain-containing protein [uncultured Thiothrix sp.]|uniref:IPTL-CTERM sorting domain-containing protein n=1 Tax=uncultured Thiothrix sp. TaxID=223185 RepID=UPI0026043313|nr:IPTL-CTERM sorting domain-containing protein [uncultured Thiothrix sp.]
MMKITKFPLSISILSLLAVLSSVQASETITNCTQVIKADGTDIDSTPGNRLTGTPVEDDEACIKLLIPFDYGDAPDPLYPSLNANNGARHQLGTGVFLGSCVDSDTGVAAGGGALGGMATQDDLSVDSPAYGACTAGDDEDGVTIGALDVGVTGVAVDVTASATCKLNAWIDWNGDGNWTGPAEKVFTNVQLNAGANKLSVDVPSFAVIGDSYARFRCSTAGDDGITGEAADGEVEDYKVTIGKTVKTPVSLGNYIWLDGNQDGQQTKGEFGLVGAVVTLMKADGTVARDLDGLVVAAQTIAAAGDYRFTNLPEGDYIVKVTPPAGYVVTSGGADVDTDTSDTDNNCVANNSGAQTLPITLAAGTEPTTDGDDANGNMTADCGFYQSKTPLYSIGNQVWVDDGAGVSTNANNGKRDTGEAAVMDGVQIELRDSKGAVVQTATTANGFYLFSGLAAGDYQVCLTAANFTAKSLLLGYTASTGGNEADANLNIDNNDNGSDTTTAGLCSNLVSLGDNEPTAESPTASGTAGADGAGTDDNRSNLTVDFGVVPPKAAPSSVSVGDLIWMDGDADGVRDTDELGLAGATVNLLTATGTIAKDLDGKDVVAQITGADGKYLFTHLPAGDYQVTVKQPTGYFLSLGGLDVDDDTNNSDSNCVLDKTGLAKTPIFSLAEGTEPDLLIDGDGTNGNLTADCGFYPNMSIGDTVWEDKNANGVQDAGEPGLTGAVVTLTGADGISAVSDVNGKPVSSITTGADGKYQFTNLVPGTYSVNVKPTAGYHLSPGGADPDTNTSNVDSNCKAVEGGFQTLSFKIMSLDGKTGLSNNTIDCGFYRSVGLGNRLWIDLNNDGKQDANEPGVPKATVSLVDVNGKPVTDIYGKVVAPQITGANGDYFFGNLREGDYVLQVTPPAGYSLTKGGSDPNDNVLNDSNGITKTDGTVSSLPIKLTWGSEPTNDGDNDPSTNLTIGFGFVAPEGSLQIPTLSQWGLGILSMLLTSLAFWRRRKS